MHSLDARALFLRRVGPAYSQGLRRRLSTHRLLLLRARIAAAQPLPFFAFAPDHAHPLTTHTDTLSFTMAKRTVKAGITGGYQKGTREMDKGWGCKPSSTQRDG